MILLLLFFPLFLLFIVQAIWFTLFKDGLTTKTKSPNVKQTIFLLFLGGPIIIIDYCISNIAKTIYKYLGDNKH